MGISSMSFFRHSLLLYFDDDTAETAIKAFFGLEEPSNEDPAFVIGIAVTLINEFYY